MEEAFENLKKSGKASVDSVIQWMKDAKIIDGIKVTEEKARSYFNEVADKGNVTLENFNMAVTKAASEQKTNLEEVFKSMNEGGSRFVDALKAGTSAFKDALNKKE